MKKVIFIGGMSCEHCVNHVSSALKELTGVNHVEVNLTDKNAILELSQDISNEVIENAIDEAGYEVTKIEDK